MYTCLQTRKGVLTKW